MPENYILLIILSVFALLAAYLLIYFIRSKKSFAILVKQLDNYNSIIDQANDAMLVIDIVDGRIHQSNPSAAKMLEYSENELSKLSLFDLHPKEYLSQSSAVVADVWEKGGMIYKDIPFITKSKKLLPVECSAKVAPFAGRPAIVIYARDITLRLALENEIIAKNKIIEEKNKSIQDSIHYARRIQRSIFPADEDMRRALGEHFIFYKPLSVVSGDFYWMTHAAKANADHKTVVLAVADCTGHGVPGALMSIIGNTLLNQTINNPGINSPAEILDFLNAELPKNLKQQQDIGYMRDGMDIAICTIDGPGMFLHFAGAYHSLYIVREGEIIELKGDKQAISAAIDMEKKAFGNQSVLLHKNDSIYLFTDGYSDQFGGAHEKKFLRKKLKELLLSVQDKNMNAQKEILSATFDAWKGDWPQVDDVLVIGFKIS